GDLKHSHENTCTQVHLRVLTCAHVHSGGFKSTHMCTRALMGIQSTHMCKRELRGI
ncbi:hypothetical protein C0J52_01579, partial [Blattella germanica]